MIDEEIVKMRHNALVGVLLFMVFMVPLLIFVFKGYNVTSNNEEVDIILVKDNNCNNCNIVEKILKVNDISYKILKKSNDNYNDVLRRYKSQDYGYKGASLLYIKDKTIDSFIIDVNEEQAKKFLANTVLKEE